MSASTSGTVGKMIDAINPAVAICKAGFDHGEGIINSVSKLVDSFSGLELEKSKTASEAELGKKRYECSSNIKMKQSSYDLKKHLSDNEVKKHISDNQKEILIKMIESDKFNGKTIKTVLQVGREIPPSKKALSWSPSVSEEEDEE